MPDDFLSSLSFQLRDLVAPGTAGGIANVFFLREHNPWEIVRILVIGISFAYFFAPLVSAWFNLPLGTSGFAVGFLGVEAAKRMAIWPWIRHFKGSQND